MRSYLGKLCLFLALTGSVGCQRLSRRDLIIQGAVAVTLAADMVSTMHVTDMCREANPVIGRCGERVPVAVFFPLVLVAHTVLTATIPEGTWRTGFQSMTVGVEGHAAFRNTMVRMRRD